MRKATLLIAVTLLAGDSLCSQETSPAPAATSPKVAREVVFEVPGITCVSRFTDSLKQHIVGQLDGVHGVTFQYLPQEPHPEQMKRLAEASGKGEIVFGGLGMLTFRVDPDFDTRVLVRRLVDSRLYRTEHWMLVERTLLSEFQE